MSTQACMKEEVLIPSFKVTYNCIAPPSKPALLKPEEPLPLQVSAIANLQWASVFIDHAGRLINSRDQEYEQLKKQYKTALDTIGKNETDIKSLKKENTTLDHKIEHLQADVARQATAYQNLDKEFDQSRCLANSAKEELTKELNATRKKFNSAISNVRSLEAKLIEADRDAHATWVHERLSDIGDNKVLEDLRHALDREIKAKAIVQENLDRKTKRVLQIEQELKAAKDGKAVLEKKTVRLNEQIEKLQQDASNRNRTIGRNECELAKLREDNTALNFEKKQLFTDLAKKTAELHAAKQDLVAVRKEVGGLNDKLSRKTAEIQKLSNQLKEQKYQHDTLQAQLETTICELVDRIDKLMEHDEQDEKKLAQLAIEMELLSKSLSKATADDESDKSTINQLKISINELTEVQAKLEITIGKLTGNDIQAKTQIERFKKTIAALKVNLKDTELQKKASDSTSNILKNQVNGLQQKVKQVTSDDAKDKRAIIAAQKETKSAKKKAFDAETKRKAAEAAAAKAALELEEAKKALKPIQLANPIALVGNLKGAPRDVDDETFYINCSFPVTLFNARSSKIYISTNGLLTLDRESTKYDYQKLPCRTAWPLAQQPLPDYVLAPFWADLYIYQNTPQGVYYEETGCSPNRKLEIEWYVSRYNSPKQYYHFSLVVEEAKPNLTTFKYFEALDKGAKCTIGVQGPRTASMFSYNEEKALPGTQVTFDTDKNTFTTSHFDITTEVENAAKKGSAVNDVKPVNAVSTTVEEVVCVD